MFVDNDEDHAAAIIERCAATISEVKVSSLPAHLLCESAGSGRPSVLARCTRLEFLTHASQYTPAVWLGLSQLHTLHDVDLSKVSVAAIAAALPLLHTLTAHYRDSSSGRGFTGTDDAAIVAGFFTDLLPRLRVLRFVGKWPATAATAESAPRTAPPPLPLLEVLEWRDVSHPPQSAVLRGFLGARPTFLSAPNELIAECMNERDSSGESAGSNLLTGVCNLRVGVVGPRIDFSAAARVLRVAPQLRTFTVSVFSDTSWLTTSDAPLVPAFVGLVHPRLRYFIVQPRFPPRSSDERCASRLRRTCFPRLQELAVASKTFFATCDVL
jgi:hypothetical protein